MSYHYWAKTIILLSLTCIVSCRTPDQSISTEVSQQIPGFREGSNLGKSVLEHLPIAVEQASQVFPDPVLININVPVGLSKDVPILTKFHFEAFEMKGIYVVVSCGMKNCEMEEYSTGKTFLMMGREPIETETILVDSTDALEISLSHLEFEIDQFDESHLLLVNDEKGDAVWVVNFHNPQGDDLQIRISPQTGEIIEVLQ